ncbi:MAG: DUF262 domain-containing HNH endonuclease family protein [Meiothermus ruber]|nr:DUF262 domain-containing HNH endonuclease family protein [Meiothermus ruber]
MKSFVEILEKALQEDCNGLAGLGRDKDWADAVDKQPQLSPEPLPEDPVAYALAKGREALRKLKEGKQEEAYAALSEAVEENPRLGRGKALELLVRLAECQGKWDELQRWQALQEREEKTLRQASPGLALMAALQEVPAAWWRQIFDSEKPAVRDVRPKLKLPKALWEGLLEWVERIVPRGREEPAPVLGLVSAFDLRGFSERDLEEEPEREGHWEDEEGVLRVRPGETQRVRVNLEAVPGLRGGVLLLESQEERALLLLPFSGRKYRAEVRLNVSEGEPLRAVLWNRETLRPRVLKALLAQAPLPRAQLVAWLREGLEQGRLEGRGWKQWLRELEEASESNEAGKSNKVDRKVDRIEGESMFGVASIRAQEVSLRQLLEGSKVYRVPLFQRPYTWGKLNWQALWDDLEGTFGSPSYRHFLGPILTIAHPATPVGIAPYTIVDGQQRLVTVALLLAALRDKAKDCQLSPLPAQLDDLLKNRYTNPPDDLKIQPTHADQAAFGAIVRPSGSGAATGSLINKVYDFFRNKITDWLNSHTCPDLIRLANTLLDQMVVVHITLGEKDSAYRIFESLNYKGVPLTLVDLVRNYLFMQLSTAAVAVHTSTWSPIEADYQKHFPPSAKNNTRHLDEMSDGVWHYVRMGGDEIRRPDAYPALVKKHQHWVSSKRSPVDFVQDLAESLKDYLHFQVPSLEPKPLRERFEALVALKFGAAAPLVMALKKRVRDGKLTDKTAAVVLKVLEAYYVHRLLAGLPTNSLGRVVLEVLRNGILDEKDPVVALCKFLKDRPAQMRWPSRAEVENGLPKQNVETYAPYLLRRLEQQLWKTLGRKETPTLEGLTLEHIMPKTMNTHWKSELGADWVRVHREYLHTLPNLTLTGYNAEMGNKPYAEKLDYLKKSTLSLNQEYFGKSAPTRWDENALKHRAAWLIDLIFAVWPDCSKGAPE